MELLNITKDKKWGNFRARDRSSPVEDTAGS